MIRIELAVAISVLLLASAACGPRPSDTPRTSSGIPPTATIDGHPITTVFALTRFSSFEEAETAAGFSIPEPNGYVRTHLSAQGGRRPGALTITVATLCQSLLTTPRRGSIFAAHPRENAPTERYPTAPAGVGSWRLPIASCGRA